MTIITANNIEFDQIKQKGLASLGFNPDGSFSVKIYGADVDPFKYPNRFRFATTINISSREFRKNNPTKASVEDLGLSIILTDDAGHRYSIRADRYVLDRLLFECDEEQIPLVK